jgi:hypothetical protein
VAIYRSDRWTCDRCRVEAACPRDRQPDGWVGVITTFPPEASPDDSLRRHLCKLCAEELAGWLERPVALSQAS